MLDSNFGIGPVSDWFDGDVSRVENDNVGQVSLRAATLPIFSLDDISFQLTNVGWGGQAHSFNIAIGGTLTVDLTGITADSRFFAEAALEAWSKVSGINFSTSFSGTADITFDDNIVGGGAIGGFSYFVGSGNIADAYVSIETSWISGDAGNLNSYSFQVYMHEIGHALGLAHAGDYNYVPGGPTINYQEDGSGYNHYLNDSWQATLMSYFSQSENTSIDASYVYAMTPMIADIIAIQNLYGIAGDIRDGNTTYGENSNAGGYYDTVFTLATTFTILDDGGIDTIDFSSVTANQTVNLLAEGISDVNGFTGNMIIARGTVIENFFSGSGDDSIYGNSADNLIKGGGGNDLILGYDGNDKLVGDAGDDTLKGGDGNDRLKGGDGDDLLIGGDGDDFLRGGHQDDVLKGGAGADILYGGSKHDKLIGGSGNDILYGGSGRDVLWGGAGDDILTGGVGRDKLIGGGGADTFVFNTNFGVDRIRDFEDDIDTIHLDADIWGGGLTVQQVLDTYGSFNAAKGLVELDFGNGDIIRFQGITDINVLLDDILII
ncbi:MAG: M10 family metallopeptidase C-terminal domain-containing protein [Rhodobacteraceae bacterium]|nr:M10 family metallopeptidase C-terminal domain-containing protein [Paracoccaceae bacterium]